MKQTQFRIFGPGRLQLWEGWALTEFEAWSLFLKDCCREVYPAPSQTATRITLLTDHGYYIVKAT